MIRLLAAVSAAALMLAACTADEPVSETADPSAQTASAEPAAPQPPEGFELSTVRETENYRGTAEIDPAILAFDPALAYRLWGYADEQLDQLATDAEEGRRMADEDAAETGNTSWFMGYTLDITHKSTLVLEDVISVSDFTGTYTGGAHPNYFLGGGVYRKGEEGSLPLSTFVSDGSAFNDLVIRALADERIERGFEPAERAYVEAGLRELLAPSTEVPDVYAGRFLLAASTEAGKAGGITVVFSPYDIGSYAEGSYQVTVPGGDLAPILTEAWAPHFGGAPLVEEEAPAAEE